MPFLIVPIILIAMIFGPILIGCRIAYGTWVPSTHNHRKES